jgi:hypothetical protein
MIDEFPPLHRDVPFVSWRFACTDAQLAEWEHSPEHVSVAIDYQLSDAPEAWWRLRVVTQCWLQGLLARRYTAGARPALLIVPDGPLAERRASITRLLGPESALDLSRVAERVLSTRMMPAGAESATDLPA